MDKNEILKRIERNDFRGLDVSQYDSLNWNDILSEQNQNLIFDSKTIFPDSVKNLFQTRLERAKVRGPYIEQLHNLGYTGRGITVAIIDSKLRTTHNGIRDNLTYYKEIGNITSEPEMHGSAVSSILCDRDIGILPDAKLMYFATPSGKDITVDTYIDAIYQTVEYNKQLSEKDKIKVISISFGLNDGTVETREKVQRAISVCRDNDIFIAFTGSHEFYNIGFIGTDRKIDSDLNNPKNYGECIFLSKRSGNPSVENIICVPQDRITTASPAGDNDYVYYTDGGMSWATPYFAGMYALAKSVDNSITPEKFRDLALSTGDNILIKNVNCSFINPIKMVKSLEFENATKKLDNKEFTITKRMLNDR